MGWFTQPNGAGQRVKSGDSYSSFEPDEYVYSRDLYACIRSVDNVTVQYWSFTDTSPDDFALVHSASMQLSDVFDPTYNQNSDADPSNDWMPYRPTGWSDIKLNTYWASDPTTLWPTIRQLIGNAFLDSDTAWDGLSPINLYCEYELRMFDVHYNLYGYEDEYYFDVDQQFSWFDCPVNDTIQWQGHRLDAILDDEFNAIDSTMTCGDIWLRLNPDYPILAYPDDVLNIEYVWTTLDYTVSLYYPNGIKETLSVLYPQEIYFPTSGSGFDYPGYNFIGWFTQPDGAGEQILDGRRYGSIVRDDAIQNLDLYAYFVPSIGGSSVSSMSVLDEVASSIQTASEPAPASSAASATRSLASAAQAASKPQDAVSAALQLASMQATASTLADSVQMDAVNGLAADDATSSAPLYPAAACAASTYEMIAGSAAGHTVCPAQTMQAVLPSVTRRVA